MWSDERDSLQLSHDRRPIRCFVNFLHHSHCQTVARMCDRMLPANEQSRNRQMRWLTSVSTKPPCLRSDPSISSIPCMQHRKSSRICYCKQNDFGINRKRAVLSVSMSSCCPYLSIPTHSSIFSSASSTSPTLSFVAIETSCEKLDDSPSSQANVSYFLYYHM